MYKYRIADFQGYPYNGYLWEYDEEWKAVSGVCSDQTENVYVLYRVDIYDPRASEPTGVQPDLVIGTFRNGRQLWPPTG